MTKPLDEMTEEEYHEHLMNKPPPDQEFLDWELDMLKKQVAAGMITQESMDNWLLNRKRTKKMKEEHQKKNEL